MEKENSNEPKIRHAEADGIKEYDNPMPSWWLGLFYFTIVFGLGYMVHQHVLGSGQGLEDELAVALDAQKAKHDAQVAAYAAAGGSKTIAEVASDPASLAEGKQIYMDTCVPCHGEHGQGGIGPNLTDDYWIHGNTDEDLIRSTTNGFPEMGMPPWGEVIGPEKIQLVTAYITTLYGTNPAEAKEPQGEKREPRKAAP